MARNDRGSWAIGGATLAGLGVGLFFLPVNVLAFLASLLVGLGAGLVLSSFIKRG